MIRLWTLPACAVMGIAVMGIMVNSARALAHPTTSMQSSKVSVLADPPMIGLGFIQPRSTITRTFRLSNITLKPITITSVTPSCTCATMDAVGKVIPAQASIELPVTMKVAASTGVKTASVTLTFSDRSAPVQVNMSGEVVYAVRSTCMDIIAGARVPFINIFDDPSRQRDIPPPPLAGTMMVMSVDRRPFRILSVMNEPPQFAGFDPAKDPPDSSYELVYDFSKIPCDRMPPYLIIETDHPLAPVVDMRIRHQCTKINPVIPFAEYRANLGAVIAGTLMQFEFELKKSAGWHVVSVQSKDPRFAVALMSQRADAENAMIAISILVEASVRGVILAPVTMTATDPSGAVKTSDFWVYFKGVAAESAGVQAGAPASAPATNPPAN